MADHFGGVVANGVFVFSGTPDCQAGHNALLDWLGVHAAPFLEEADSTDNILRGNLGESIAFCVSYWHDCVDYRAYATNAWRPFRPKSDIDIDIVWLAFAHEPKDDLAIVQEVKTTSDSGLGYARELVDDYQKLFGTNIRLTIHTRLQDIKIDFRYKVGGEDGRRLAQRISLLAGQSPMTSPKLKLRPTLVHEKAGTKPRERMTAIRTTLLGRGWSSEAVECWAIGLTELDDRLVRLATGKN